MNKKGLAPAATGNAKVLAAGWLATQDALALKLDDAEKDAWLVPLRLVSLDAGAVGLSGIESPFLRKRIQTLFMPLLLKALQVGFPQWQAKPPVKLYWGMPPQTNFAPASPANPASPPSSASTPLTKLPKQTAFFSANAREHPAWLEQRHFDSFVAHQGCQDALRLAQDASQQQAALWNPLVFYGPTGVGKTHLLYAMHHALQHSPHTTREADRVLLMSAERFKQRTLEAIRKRKSHVWQKTLQQAQVLLLDGLEDLLVSRTSQEALLHCMDTLHAAQCQLVITSQAPPEALPTLHEALCSRLNMGLVFALQAPNQQGRRQLLQAFLKKEQVRIQPEALRYLEKHLAEDVRQIHGAVIRLSAQQRLEAVGAPFSVQQIKTLCQGFLRHHQAKPPQAAIPARPIVEAVCQHFQVTAQALSGRQRGVHLVHARRTAIYCLRQFGQLPYQEIAALLGGRSASTIVEAYQTQQKLLEQQPSLRVELQHIRRRISA